MSKSESVPFSVLMSVYRNDTREFVEETIKSIWNRQILKPDEIVIVVDGPITEELSNYIHSLSSNEWINVYWHKENQGLGKTMAFGVLQCKNELVARMDSDDIAMPDRFAKQVEYLSANPSISIVGGQISEFIDSPENIVGYRKVPLESEECRLYYRNRDPLNHMTVMFRKSAILASGNYQHWHLDEDTYLWGRVLKKGFKIANLPDVLVNVRSGKDMYARRGGLKYFKSDTAILKWKHENGFIGYGRYAYNYLIRFIVQVIMPNKVRGFIFSKLLRKKNNNIHTL